MRFGGAGEFREDRQAGASNRWLFLDPSTLVCGSLTPAVAADSRLARTMSLKRMREGLKSLLEVRHPAVEWVRFKCSRTGQCMRCRRLSLAERVTRVVGWLEQGLQDTEPVHSVMMVTVTPARRVDTVDTGKAFVGTATRWLEHWWPDGAWVLEVVEKPEEVSRILCTHGGGDGRLCLSHREGGLLPGGHFHVHALVRDRRDDWRELQADAKLAGLGRVDVQRKAGASSYVAKSYVAKGSSAMEHLRALGARYQSGRWGFVGVPRDKAGRLVIRAQYGLGPEALTLLQWGGELEHGMDEDLQHWPPEWGPVPEWFEAYTGGSGRTGGQAR